MNDEVKRRALILADVLGASPTTPESELTLHVLAQWPSLPTELGLEDLARLADRLSLPVSRRRAARRLIAAGLADASGEGVRLRPTITQDEMSRRGAGVAIDDLRGWIESLTGATDRPGALDASAMVDAVRRSAHWAAALSVAAERRGLAGLPVFWEETQSVEDPFQPSTTDVGSIATVDGLLMVLNGLKMDSEDLILRDAARQLTRSLVRMQVLTEGWHHGAQVTPQWDDDFVGSFLPSHADRGPCPTLDATACLASALSVAVVAPDLEHDPGIRSTIGHAVNCVVRWQAHDGSWAIHSYDPSRESWQMPARTLSVYYAVEALYRAQAIVGGDYSDAARRALGFVRSAAIESDGDVHWRLDFGRTDDASDVGATALMLPTIVALGELSGEDVSYLTTAATDYLRHSWEPNASAYLLVPFRVPTWEGPAVDTFTWELPLDPLVVSALLTNEPSRRMLTHDDRALIAQATTNFLAACRPAGYWVDLLMAAAGSVRGMTGNSDYFQTAVVDVLRDQRLLLMSLSEL